MGYTNFWDAWQSFNNVYDNWRSALVGLDYSNGLMQNRADEGNWWQAFEACKDCFQIILNIHNQYLDMQGVNPASNHFYSCIYWASKSGTTVDITMDAILDAMLNANPDEVKYFVGLVDAYRQSIWNKPYYQEYFASLSRGFEQWE